MITICDFDDSFTYNLFSDLSKFTPKIEVLHYKKDFLKLMKRAASRSPSVLVLGPGPGHPEEYNQIHTLIEESLKNELVLLVGICLGHQLVLDYMGAKCISSENIMHGQQVELPRFSQFLKHKSSNKVLVQRYNSLVVQFTEQRLNELEASGWTFYTLDNDIYASRAKNKLTYQFHPESIGSISKNLLYSPIKEFLLKCRDEI